MQLDPFGVGLAPTVDPFQSPFQGFGFDPFAEHEQRGIIRTILEETARDVVGGAKVASALALSPLTLLSDNVPITFEDLNTRDFKGAAMLAALGVGGVIGGAVRGTAAVKGIAAANTALGRAGATAIGEAAAGAGFGLIRPIEEDDSRIKAVLGDAALFGTLGAGASFAKSGAKAALSGTLGQVREGIGREAMMQAEQLATFSSQARPLAGFRLRDPLTKGEAVVIGAEDGTGRFIRLGEKAVTREFKTFDEAAQAATKEGFLETTGAASERVLTRLTGDVDRATLESMGLLNREQLQSALRQIELKEYQSVRDAAKSFVEAEAEYATLAAEIAAPTNRLGVPIFGAKSTRESVASELGLNSKIAAKMSDSDLLRAAVRAGTLDSKTIKHATDMNTYFRELVFNDVVPRESLDVFTSRIKDGGLMLRIISPSTISKLHPEFAPLQKSAQLREELTEEGKRLSQSLWSEVTESVGMNKKEVAQAVKIIDRSGGPERSLVEAQQIALQEARATGNENIVNFIDKITTRLNEYEARLVKEGFIEKGIAGYFPIVNTNQWKLDLKGEFGGFFKSQRAAERELQRLKVANPELKGTVVPNSFTWDLDVLESAADFAKLRGKVGTMAGAFKHRELGLRDFSKAPEEAWNTYVATVERALNWKDFRGEATDILATIPQSKGNLKAYTEQYVADLLGEARPTEIYFQQFAEWLSSRTGGGLPVPARALKKYTAALRNWESFSRLGGFTSGIVNNTQIIINTYPTLGAKWTVRGMEVLNPNKYRSRVATMLKNGVEGIEHFVPLTSEGQPLLNIGIKSKLKQKKYKDVLFQSSLYVFNSAEKINRVVTAWGAYQRGLAEGLGVRAAADAASQAVARTQFNYVLSDMPQILRSPLGSVLGQFKSFVIKELEFVSSLNAAEARRFGAAIWATGGAGLLINTPGPDLIDEASGLFFDKKFSESLKLSQFQESALGRSVVFGLPGLIFGVDVSDYVGVGSVRDITRGLFGPAVNDLKAFSQFVVEGSKDIAQGKPVSQDVSRTFVQRAVPSAIRRAMRAQDILATGEVRNPYSRKLIYRPQDRAQEARRTLIGFPSIELQQERAMDQIASRTVERFKRNRSEAAKEIALEVIDGKDVSGLIRDANAAGYGIDQQTIRRTIKELQRTAAERRRRRTPRALRPSLDDLYETTGSIGGGL
jgi:hypothetical protein